MPDKSEKLCIQVFDLRSGCSGSLWEVALSDFPYSAGFYGKHLICGCGDGSLSVLDVESLNIQATLSTDQAAIRFMHAVDGQIICGGDNGSLHFYTVH